MFNYPISDKFLDQKRTETAQNTALIYFFVCLNQIHKLQISLERSKQIYFRPELQCVRDTYLSGLTKTIINDTTTCTQLNKDL